MHAALARTSALAGKRKAALAILRKLEGLAKSRYVSPFEFAGIQFALGHPDLGFNWLTKACQDRAFELLTKTRAVVSLCCVGVLAPVISALW